SGLDIRIGTSRRPEQSPYRITAHRYIFATSRSEISDFCSCAQTRNLISSYTPDTALPGESCPGQCLKAAIHTRLMNGGADSAPFITLSDPLSNSYELSRASKGKAPALCISSGLLRCLV